MKTFKQFIEDESLEEGERTDHAKNMKKDTIGKIFRRGKKSTRKGTGEQEKSDAFPDLSAAKMLG